jgi:DNA-binding winged helix-turn-helix (wHTH) protein/tetratricopeptide (TPR) repeat protein
VTNQQLSEPVITPWRRAFYALESPEGYGRFRYVPPWPYAMNTEPKVVYEFGPFRMDPDKQVLLRDGQLIAVTPKAFETLLVLVRRGREVVSKEELLKEIWPDSFVEEANLSQHIFKLRKALGDTLEGDRYIVTLPGRGYRFAVPVRTITEGGEVLIAQMRSRAEIVIEEQVQDAGQTQPAALPPQAHARPKWQKWLLAVGAAAAIAGLAALLLLRHHPAIPLSAQDSVLVADFTNRTGDPVFDNALRQGLEVQLQQSPYLNLVSQDRIQQTLRLMGQPPETQVTGQVAREVCVRTGTAAMLEGSIQNLGARYVLNLRATNCRTGDVIDREQVEVARKEEVLQAITRMTTGFRRRVGESGTTLQEHDVPLAEATTASIDALQSYSLGLQALAGKGEKTSATFFKRAVELDPKFAMAYAWLGLMYGSTGSSELATANIRKAYELADRVSDNERFFISAYYQGRGTGNQEKARQICEEWAETYPRDPFPHSFLAGFIYPALANYDKAIEEARKGMELAPELGFFYFALGVDSLYAGDLNTGEEALRRASGSKIENPQLLLLRYDLAFLKDDREGMQQAVKAAQGESESMDWIADRQAFSFAYAGRLQKARVLSRQAIDLAQQQGDGERAALFAIRSALWEAFFGNAREAKQGAATALALASNREVQYGAAIASGLAGDSAQAQALADHLYMEFPEDTSIRFSYLPVIHAIVALRRNDPAEAIHALEPAIPYELGAPRGSVTCYFGALYPILFRGEAYLAAHKGPEAAREYQKLLDHRGIMIGDPVAVLAHLGLARSYALSGDVSNARNQYKEFLTLWKDADPDLPVLHKARAGLTRLQ